MIKDCNGSTQYMFTLQYEADEIDPSNVQLRPRLLKDPALLLNSVSGTADLGRNHGCTGVLVSNIITEEVKLPGTSGGQSRPWKSWFRCRLPPTLGRVHFRSVPRDISRKRVRSNTNSDCKGDVYYCKFEALCTVVHRNCGIWARQMAFSDYLNIVCVPVPGDFCGKQTWCVD